LEVKPSQDVPTFEALIDMVRTRGVILVTAVVAVLNAHRKAQAAGALAEKTGDCWDLDDLAARRKELAEALDRLADSYAGRGGDSA
jgi:hypothetical protein